MALANDAFLEVEICKYFTRNVTNTSFTDITVTFTCITTELTLATCFYMCFVTLLTWSYYYIRPEKILVSNTRGFSVISDY